MKSHASSSIELKIAEQFGRIIKKFKILHHGWEADGYGYIVNDGNINKIITTNHSKPIAIDVSCLKSKIKEYNEVILETNEAIKFIENAKH
jgi:hypothetical protein